MTFRSYLLAKARSPRCPVAAARHGRSRGSHRYPTGASTHNQRYPTVGGISDTPPRPAGTHNRPVDRYLAVADKPAETKTSARDKNPTAYKAVPPFATASRGPPCGKAEPGRFSTQSWRAYRHVVPIARRSTLSGEGWSGHDGGLESVSGTGTAVPAGAHTGQRHTTEQVAGTPGGLGSRADGTDRHRMTQRRCRRGSCPGDRDRQLAPDRGRPADRRRRVSSGRTTTEQTAQSAQRG